MSTALRITLDEYDRMIEAGVFEPDGPSRRRIELIHGEIREMSPIGPDHENDVDYLNAIRTTESTAK